MTTTTFELGAYGLDVVTDAGPRILGFRPLKGTSLFADLPEAVIEWGDADPYRLLGGHRLWRAPEVPEITYRPEGNAVTITKDDGRLAVRGQPDNDGVVKELELMGVGDVLRVEHRLINTGSDAVSCAPWGITQLTPGGTAVLPQRLESADAHGLQANRQISLWPYTDPGSAAMAWGRERVSIDSAAVDGKLKIGQPNHSGFLAYAHAGRLFVKWAPPHRDELEYADLGASAQVYVDGLFVELETLGPLAQLQPAETASHTEVWLLTDIGDGVELGAALDGMNLPIEHPALAAR